MHAYYIVYSARKSAYFLTINILRPTLFFKPAFVALSLFLNQAYDSNECNRTFLLRFTNI